MRATLKSKLNAKHVFQAVNTWVVPTVRYSAGIIEWTIEEVKKMDWKTRKIITMYARLHPRSNVKRLYPPRSEGGRGLVSIEDCVNDERKNWALYGPRSNEELIAATTELELKEFINVQNRQERRNNIWLNRKRKLFTVNSWGKQKKLMIEIDGNGRNKENSSVKQKTFCVLLKNKLCKLMTSNTQFIRQAILHYVDSVTKRQKV